MISCTEFIPAYSELFKFIEQREGYEGVVEYWNLISDEYVEGRLGEEVRKSGLAGCFDYWAKALNEEAADFTMTLDEDNGFFEIVMHSCPSKGRLLEFTHMEPYPRYSDHCDVLYRRVLEKFGYVCTYQLPRPTEKHCSMLVFDPKVADADTVAAALERQKERNALLERERQQI